MDGLDVYIDDYTRPDPIPPAMLERLEEFARRLLPTAPEQEQPGPVAAATPAVGDSSDATAAEPANEPPAADHPAPSTDEH